MDKDFEKHLKEAKEKGELLNKIMMDSPAMYNWMGIFSSLSPIYAHLNFDIKTFVRETTTQYKLRPPVIPLEVIDVDGWDSYEEVELIDDDEFEYDDDYFDNPVPDFSDEDF